MTQSSRISIFSRLSFATIIALYFLILVGGIVRSTGSGMGCPDWPKCFGRWIPPMNQSQLPENYQDIYTQKRLKQSERFSRILSAVGLKALSNRVLNHSGQSPETKFNVIKTWIEYLNRLVGVMIGIFVGATFLSSILIRKEIRSVFTLSLLALLLVAIEGWLGSLVVSTHLLPGMVTLHMTLALLIVGLMIFLFYKSRRQEINAIEPGRGRSSLNILMVLCMLTFLSQIVLGTQVRESIDSLASAQVLRSEWISQLGWAFLIHRSYSLLILALNVALLYFLLRSPRVSPLVRSLAKLMAGLIILEIITGALMAYLAVPAVLQPIHLLVASVIFGLQFLVFLLLNPNWFTNTTSNPVYDIR